jgi:hypothetical protein
MDIKAAVEQIEGWAESDWIGLWEITQYVGDEIGEDGSEDLQLELVVSVVKGLLERGLCAGDSPLTNLGPRFLPWRNQDPDTITASIRQEWQRNKEFPSWGDGPWFTIARLCRLDA